MFEIFQFQAIQSRYDHCVIIIDIDIKKSSFTLITIILSGFIEVKVYGDDDGDEEEGDGEGYDD